MRKGKNSFRRAAAAVCALAMCASVMPVAAFAEEPAATQDPAAVTAEVTGESTQDTEEPTDSTGATDPVDSTESTDTTEKTDVTDATDTTGSADATESVDQTDDIDAADSTESTEEEVNAGEEVSGNTEDTTGNQTQPTETTVENAVSNSMALLSLDDEGTPENKAGEIIEIDSSEDLVDAILHQADGQTWVFTQAGTYDVYNAANYQQDKTGLPATDQKYGGYVPEETLNEGHAGSEYIFPIYVDDLTITKDASVTGEVILTSSATPGKDYGGMWNYQNFITVTGDNVTIEDVSIKANVNAANDNTCNKVIEVLADNFTVDGVTFKNVNEESENKFAGTLYVNKKGVTTTVKNCVFDYGRISLSGADATNKLVVENVKLDFAGAYNEDYYAFYNPNGTPVEAKNLIVTATPQCLDAEPNSMGEMMGMLPDYTTLQLKPGNYNLVPGKETVNGETGWYMPITKPVTVQGIDENGNVITDAAQAQANIYSTDYSANGAWPTQNLITVFSDDVVLEGLVIMNKVAPNKAIEVVGDESAAMDFTVRNCKFAPIAEELLENGVVTDADGKTVYAWDEYKEYGASLYFSAKGKCEINATVENNYFDHSGISLGATTKGVYTISGNTFDGAKNWNNDPNYYYSSIGYQGKWLYPDPDCTTLGDAVVNVTGNTFNDAGEINFSQVTTGDGVVDLSGNSGLDTEKISGPAKVDGQMVIDGEAALKVAIAAAQPGDTITLGAGEFTFTDAIVLNKKLTIQGSGEDTVIIGNYNQDYGNGLFTFTGGSEGSVLRDMTIKYENAGAQQAVVYFDYGFTGGSPEEITKIQNVNFISDGSAIAVSSTYTTGGYVEVSGCKISNFKYGMYFNGIHHLNVSGNTIDGTDYNAINIAGDNEAIGCDNISIVGNTLTNISKADYTDDTYSSGIRIGLNAEGITIQNNKITMLNGKQAIYFDPAEEGETPSHYIVTFMSDGAEVSKHVTGDNFTLPAAPAKSGYTFLGWSDGTNTYSAGEEVKISANATFTALWKQNSTASSNEESSETTTSQSTTQSGSNITYYTCQACGYHDWTATAEGYKCNHCGYVESAKQLSGYGNVKGVYEPKTSAAAAQSVSAVSSSSIPQTGDAMPISLMGGVTVIAAAVFVALFVLRKRQNND